MGRAVGALEITHDFQAFLHVGAGIWRKVTILRRRCDRQFHALAGAVGAGEDGALTRP